MLTRVLALRTLIRTVQRQAPSRVCLLASSSSPRPDVVEGGLEQEHQLNLHALCAVTTQAKLGRLRGRKPRVKEIGTRGGRK